MGHEPVQGVQELDDDQDRESHGHGLGGVERLAPKADELLVLAKVSALVDLGRALHEVGLETTIRKWVMRRESQAAHGIRRASLVRADDCMRVDHTS